ncbi:PP2C family protein-serine/threonine phosphatase [Kutzneria kofuensis]|uniref:Serine phosphatase RsbU (Regulator of sigma subunit) n=1 Tax=Kutzneria kofuensis TaxID=103725 RepID=A0A7W9KQQ2_9PSEU|nr:PP2C family protein-serine/threonine phosphatase [Kutzneria kofuensis]MBB5896987.1 serine phosphatase RsbU (regulator of sigma subunit) [Kutzneria kofuensis]
MTDSLDAEAVLLVGDRGPLADRVATLLSARPYLVIRLGEEVPVRIDVEMICSMLDSVAAVLLPDDLTAEDAGRIRERAREASGRPPVILYTGDPAVVADYQARGLDVLASPFSASYLAHLLDRGRSGKEAELARALGNYQRELQAGAHVQQNLLPTEPAPNGWRVSVRSEPARTVSGDFHDTFPLLGGRRFGFVVADVSGKGVSAGLYVALIRGLLRRLVQDGANRTAVHEMLEHFHGEQPVADETVPRRFAAGEPQLLEAVRTVNAYLAESRSGSYFATLFAGALNPETGAVSYVNAGHPPGLLLGADGSVRRLDATGPVVGLVSGADFETKTLTIEPGETLLLYTDGITEARSIYGNLVGEPALIRVLQDSHGDPERLWPQIRSLVLDQTDGRFRDDVTAMVLQRTRRG